MRNTRIIKREIYQIQRKSTIVLLGDGGCFWVAYTLRDAEYLMSMGYEPAK